MPRTNSGTTKARAAARQACTFARASYGPYEANVFDNTKEVTYCFMTEHDELLGNTYRSQMEAHMPVMTIPGGLRLSDDSLPIILQVISTSNA